VSHSQQQGNDFQNHKYSMQLEQERQEAKKRVADSDDSQRPRKRDRKKKDDSGKHADRDGRDDEKNSKREPVVEDFANIRLLDIMV
jgi:hypothetical protein